MVATCRKCGVPILETGDSPRDDYLGRGRLCVHCAGDEPDARDRFLDCLDRLVPTGPAPPPDETSRPEKESEDERRRKGTENR